MRPITFQALPADPGEGQGYRQMSTQTKPAAPPQTQQQQAPLLQTQHQQSGQQPQAKPSTAPLRITDWASI